MRQNKERRTHYEIYREIILAISNQNENNLYSSRTPSLTRIQQTTGLSFDKFKGFLEVMIKADLVISNNSLTLTPKAYLLLHELEIMDKIKLRIDTVMNEINNVKTKDLARLPVSTTHIIIDQQQVIYTMAAINQELEN